jgi:tetratricopeptide (TPR) repeat protein
MVRKKISFQEDSMRKVLIMAMLITAIITGIQIVSYAADELFDAKTASEHMAKGIAHLKAKNYDAAIDELEKSTSIYPEAEAFYYLGYAYYMKGRKGDGESRNKAMENFEQAYELDPNFTPTRLTPVESLPPKLEQKNIENRQIPAPEAPQPAQPAAPKP